VLRCVAAALGMALWLGASDPPARAQTEQVQDWASLDRKAEELYNKGDLKEAIRVARLAVDRIRSERVGAQP
jgi:hypothetical protein